jgi:hypothetical protein
VTLKVGRARLRPNRAARVARALRVSPQPTTHPARPNAKFCLNGCCVFFLDGVDFSLSFSSSFWFSIHGISAGHELSKIGPDNDSGPPTKAIPGFPTRPSRPPTFSGAEAHPAETSVSVP